MNWDFACRKGELAINNFDGRDFATGSRALSQPIASLNQFSGPLTQVNGPSLDSLTGGVTGSFMRGSPTQVLGAAPGTMTSIRGVAGNFNINASGYSAGGIFAGSGVPSIPVR